MSKNIEILHMGFNKHYEAVEESECEINRLSFFFESGNSYHFETKPNDTEEVLLYRLLGVADLIKNKLQKKRLHNE